MKDIAYFCCVSQFKLVLHFEKELERELLVRQEGRLFDTS